MPDGLVGHAAGRLVLNADTSCVDTVLVAGRAARRAGQVLHHEVATVVAALADSARAVVAA
ncbi:hypothetical protein AB0K18_17900 [Nonomuraea sp. NPDC049421]|uniref:hypothetical protein n=1 Tax=Nonomuraea sp. NPDC049421 TaxID=3155275 RepID=UPI00342A0E37